MYQISPESKKVFETMIGLPVMQECMTFIEKDQRRTIEDLSDRCLQSCTAGLYGSNYGSRYFGSI